MERATATQLTKWDEWKAPVGTVAILTALASTLLISNQTARLLTQGALLVAGGAHLYHDRKRPLFFVEMSAPSRSGLYGSGESGILNSIQDANGQPIGRQTKEQLFCITLKGAVRRTWYGAKKEFPFSGDIALPTSLLNQSVDGKLLFRYRGMPVEAKKEAHFDTIRDQFPPAIHPLDCQDRPKSWVVFKDAVISEDGSQLKEEWKRLRISSDGTLELNPEQTVPELFRQFLEDGGSIEGHTFDIQDASPDLQRYAILQHENQLYLIVPSPPPSGRVLRSIAPGTYAYIDSAPPRNRLVSITLPPGQGVNLKYSVNEHNVGTLEPVN